MKQSKKKTLPKFRPLTVAEQRELYPRVLRRAYNRTKLSLLATFQLELDQANDLEQQAGALAERIDRVEDVVANRADKTYHGWDVWRNDPVKLQQVASEMVQASRSIRDKRDALLKRAEALRKPYLLEVARLDRLQQKLLSEWAS